MLQHTGPAAFRILLWARQLGTHASSWVAVTYTSSNPQLPHLQPNSHFHLLSLPQILAEVNPHMPRTHGNTFLPVEAIDYFVRNDRQGGGQGQQELCEEIDCCLVCFQCSSAGLM